MSNYPASLDSFNVIGTTNYFDESGYVLHTQLNTHGSAVVALERTLGTTSGTSIAKDFTAGEFAIARNSGGTVTDTLTKGTANNFVFGTPAITGGAITSPTITGGTYTSPTLAGTPVLDVNSAIPFYGDNMSRQAVMNGNFDVWQRGISIALTAADGYTADRWYAETATATTDKTISRQDGTGVNGSYYCARVLAAQDVDALNTFSQALESQDSIKFRGKKLTLSFYARGGAEFVADNATLVSKIVTGKGTDEKVLAFTTSADGVSQNNTLTISWVKFTCTTTAVIAADITQIGVSFAFTHAGSGTTTNYFEVTQVQLCAGDVALPFQPKSFKQELDDCQRYYEKSYDYDIVPGATSSPGWIDFNSGTNLGASAYNALTVLFKVQKRASPVVAVYDYVGTIGKISTNDQTTVRSNNVTPSDTTTYLGRTSFQVTHQNTGEAGFGFHWTATSEL